MIIMSDIIFNSLNYFFKIRDEHKEKEVVFNDEIRDLLPTLTVNNKSMKYNLLGTLNLTTKKYIWAWHLNIPKKHCIKTKQLLIYAINKDIVTLHDAYIKRLLTSSTIESIDRDSITIIIALGLYITKADSMFTTKTDSEIINIYGLYN